MTHHTGALFLLTVLLMIFIGGLMVLKLMADKLRLLPSKLVVTGNRYYTSINDIRLSVLCLGSPEKLMTQDVNVILKLIKRLPWIKLANIRKLWPDKLKIHLIEYIPIACWNNQYMIDTEGNSFTIPNGGCGNQQDLPRIYGPEGSNSEVLLGFLKISLVLANNHFTLKDVTMTARRSWQLTLTNEIKLNLGRSNTIKRLLRFVVLYPILQLQTLISNNNKQINYVDLRYDSGAAVNWKSTIVKKSNRLLNRAQIQAE